MTDVNDFVAELFPKGPDIPALRATFDFVEKLHEAKGKDLRWDQAMWYDSEGQENLDQDFCGTAFCYAGAKAYLDQEDGICTIHQPPLHAASVAVYQKGDDSPHHVADWAMNRFGLSYHQREVMFSADNSLEDIKEFIDLLEEGDDLTGHDS